jgi:uncharacterized membrane protein
MDGDNMQSSGSQPTPAANTNTVMGILAYLGILVIIPFIVAKDDPFVKFHIKQGLVLFCIEIIMWLVASMLWMFWPLYGLVNLAVFILAIIGIINVVQHKQSQLPIVGSLASYFTF